MRFSKMDKHPIVSRQYKYDYLLLVMMVRINLNIPSHITKCSLVQQKTIFHSSKVLKLIK